MKKSFSPLALPSFQKLWVDGEGDESKEKYLHKIKDKKRGENGLIIDYF